MLFTLLHLLYIPVCLFLILVVLLQTGKRADLAGAFGGGGSQTAFGARGAATLLSKLTTIMAILFMITALSLAIMTSRRSSSGGSVMDDALDQAPASAPVVPADTPETVPAQPPLTDEPAAEETTDPAAGEILTPTEEDANLTGTDLGS